MFKVLEDLHARYYEIVGDMSVSNIDHIISSKNIDDQADIKVLHEREREGVEEREEGKCFLIESISHRFIRSSCPT
jgi:hypothetical protein